MLYHLLRPIAITGINLFYNSISVENQDRVPKKGPVIFAANHPNTMMDPLIVAASCGRRVSFLAKSTLFLNSMVSRFLSMIGIIPVYRKSDAKDDMHRNEEMFSATYRHLERNHGLLIFPEGASTPERIIHKIKTGAARIGLGAEEKNDFLLNVQIVPAGINYSASTKFRSDVHCKFGRPIKLMDYKEKYQKDNWLAVEEVTNQIRKALEKLTTTVSDKADEDIVKSLESIYKKELTVNLGMDKKSKSDDFNISKGIIKALEWFSKNKPKWTLDMKQSIYNYISMLDRLNIRDDFLSTGQSKITFFRRIQSWLFLIIGFPIFVYGVIINYLPYKISGHLAVWAVKGNIADISSKKMLIGLGFFVFWYSLLLLLFHSTSFELIWTILFFATFIPAGNFSLYYFRKAKNYQQHIRFLTIFYQKRILLYELIEKRLSIINELNRAKDDYFAQIDKNDNN